MKKFVAIYGRQSVEKKDSISIESQIEFCKGMCIGEEYRLYRDSGYSGKNTNRPDFSRMMGDIKSGVIKQVVVYKLDRISRSLLDFANIIEVFKQYNVDFVSTQEKFDTSTPMGNAMLNITMVFAQLERETIQQRITDNYYQRGKRGMHCGGIAPFGYETTDTLLDGKRCKTYKYNALEMNIVKMIFDLYGNQNLGLGEVSKRLNQEGYKTQNDGTWSSVAVRDILRNPSYVRANTDIYNYYKFKNCIVTNDVTEFDGIHACLLYGKRMASSRKYATFDKWVLSIALHEGHISSDLFLRCQFRIDNNKQIPREGIGTHSWLTGIIKCGKCGYSMVVVPPTRQSALEYFRCSAKSNGRKCSGQFIPHRVKEVEKVVETQLFDIVSRYGEIEFHEKESLPPTNEIEKMQLAHINEQINRLLEQLANGDEIVTKYIKEKITELDEKKKALENTKLQKEHHFNARAQYSARLIEMIDLWDSLEIADKKTIVREFIEKVIVTDEKIEIVWKHNFYSSMNLDATITKKMGDTIVA